MPTVGELCGGRWKACSAWFSIVGIVISWVVRWSTGASRRRPQYVADESLPLVPVLVVERRRPADLDARVARLSRDLDLQAAQLRRQEAQRHRDVLDQVLVALAVVDRPRGARGARTDTTVGHCIRVVDGDDVELDALGLGEVVLHQVVQDRALEGARGARGGDAVDVLP